MDAIGLRIDDAAQAPERADDRRQPALEIQRRQPQSRQEDHDLLQRVAMNAQGAFQAGMATPCLARRTRLEPGKTKGVPS